MLNQHLSSTIRNGLLFAMAASTAVAAPRVSLTADFADQVEARMGADISAFNRADQQVDTGLQEIRKRELATRERLSRFTSGTPEQLRLAYTEWSEMIHATHEMKADMLSLYSGESGAVEVVMNEQLAAAQNTAENVLQVIGALEDANVTDDRRTAWRATSQTARQSDRAHVSIANRALTTAGDFGLIDLSLTGSYTSFDDDLAKAGGHETEIALTTAFELGDSTTIGLTYSHATFEIGGITNLSRDSDALDLSLQYSINDWLAAAVFFGYSHISIDDTTVVDPLLGPVSLGDSYDRWNGGIALTANREIGGFDFGITPALSALDAVNPDGLFDTDQLVAICMLDAQRAWTDQFSTIFYASYFYALSDELPGDGSYWITGGEASWAFNDRISVGIGYEKTLGYAEYEDDRFLGSLTWTF